MYFNVCPRCGSNLDPGEKCSCAKPVQQEVKCHACGRLNAKADGKIVCLARKPVLFAEAAKHNCAVNCTKKHPLNVSLAATSG